jgi:hypothetical protein
MHLAQRVTRAAFPHASPRAVHHTARALIVVAAVALAVAMPDPVSAQSKPVVAVDPGMTKEQVIDRLGDPSEESHAGSFTYLMYDNECGQKCGMDDLVVLERGIVTDAVFRSGKRTYTGRSSSPSALQPAAPTHFAPAPIRASTPDDSVHRGGIVLMGPRPPARPSSYVRVVPNHADSARLAGSRPKPDTARSAPHE